MTDRAVKVVPYKVNMATPLFFLATACALIIAMMFSRAPTIQMPLGVGAILCVLAGSATGLFFKFSQSFINTGYNIQTKKFIETTPAPLILVDGLSHHVIVANKNAREFFGNLSPNMPIKTLIDNPDLPEIISLSMKAGHMTQVEFKAKEGKTSQNHAFQAHISPIGQDMVLLFIEDMSSAYRLDKMRSDFIANVSHELRTPLTAIMGYVETLQGHARDDEAVREKFLGLMYAQAQRMLRLVRDLMSLSKIELDENRAPSEVIVLTEIVSEVIDSLQPVISQHKGEVQITINKQDTPDPTFDILGARDEMIQVLQNLLDNALKYAGDTPIIEVIIGHGVAPSLGAGSLRTGDIAVSHTFSDGMPDKPIYMQVRDNGRGINRADLPRLTERFYRVNVEKSRLQGGTGLGLAIVKHAINRHNGSLYIETLDGVGTAFTCYFIPAGQAKGALASDRMARQ